MADCWETCHSVGVPFHFVKSGCSLVSVSLQTSYVVVVAVKGVVFAFAKFARVSLCMENASNFATKFFKLGT